MKVTNYNVLNMLSVVCAALATLASSPITMANDLALHFTFDQDVGGVVIDQSGNGNTGTPKGGAWTTVRGDNKAYQFSGSSTAGDVIHVLNSASLSSMQQTRELTLAMWLKVKSVAYEFPYALCRAGNLKPNAYGGYALALNSNKDNDLTFVSGNGALSTFHAYGKWINNNTGVWVHVAVTINSATGIGKYYWNGQRTNDEWYQEQYGHNLFNLNFAVTNDLYVGGPDPLYTPGGNSAWYNGAMDDLRIYSRALSDSEVEQLFQSQQDDYLGPCIVYRDADGDGYGNPQEPKDTCDLTEGYVEDSTDCDDSKGTTYPGAPELCNGLDDDCDGEVDEDVQVQMFYRDADGDGFGNAADSKESCDIPEGYVTDATDCNDLFASIYPGAPELCNGVDDDCDGEIDEGVKQTFYRDADQDGYGDASMPMESCEAPDGYVTDATDCDDDNAAVNPGATEVCNGIDDDCDGMIDEGCGDDDADDDGVPDSVDQCPDTRHGAVVNSEGCSIDQLVPCDGPWKNHGAYMKALAAATADFVMDGLITSEQRDGLVSAGARSNCGKKK